MSKRIIIKSVVLFIKFFLCNDDKFVHFVDLLELFFINLKNLRCLFYLTESKTHLTKFNFLFVLTYFCLNQL